MSEDDVTQGRRKEDFEPDLDPSVQANTTAQRIQKALKFLIVSTIVLYLGFVAVGIYVYSISRSNNNGLCALRDDADRRVETTKEFIKANPKGIPGISVAQLKRSTENSIRTARALKSVKCPRPPL